MKIHTSIIHTFALVAAVIMTRLGIVHGQCSQVNPGATCPPCATSFSPLCTSTTGVGGVEQGVQTVVCPALCGPGLDFVIKVFPLCGDLGGCFCSNLYQVGSTCQGVITTTDDNVLSNICTNCGGTLSSAFGGMTMDTNINTGGGGGVTDDGAPSSCAQRASLFSFW